jgi:hypothetical protein
MNAAQWVITAGAVCGAIAVILQTVVRPVIRWGTRIEKAVSVVEMNMMNNGGSSLRDAIDRIEARLDNLEKKPRSSTVPKKSTTKKQ